MKQYKYKINGSLYNVVILNSNDNLAEVEVNGIPYTVEIEKKTKKQITTAFKKPAQAGSPQPEVSTPVARHSHSAGDNALKSPLPGIILDITCNVGDTVKKGQKLLVLEAMKMENNIIADRDGIIKEIKVRKSDPVLEGSELLIIAG
ncbi:MAG: acetyl-CoA carboxylase biotin carboxyl carrier protein subunit [Bacteroidales bacterium]|nr:acetyl-CoA carboxylase biotin carboxyl carrier protein subunit [Bacteroidales bacterium]